MVNSLSIKKNIKKYIYKKYPPISKIKNNRQIAVSVRKKKGIVNNVPKRKYKEVLNGHSNWFIKKKKRKDAKIK
jgi:hypothetical protein